MICRTTDAPNGCTSAFGADTQRSLCVLVVWLLVSGPSARYRVVGDVYYSYATGQSAVATHHHVADNTHDTITCRTAAFIFFCFFWQCLLSREFTWPLLKHSAGPTHAENDGDFLFKIVVGQNYLIYYKKEKKTTSTPNPRHSDGKVRTSNRW